MRFGAAFWIQRTGWREIRDAAGAVEAAGFDSLWLDDHLLSDEGDWRDAKLEGWATLAAVSQVTTGLRLGLLVGANTFRNPGLTAKLATTLDHLSGGRAVLGIGGAWFEREHEAYGIPFGSGFGERLDRLDEAVMLIRRLLDGERFSHQGRFYTFTDALSEPRPVQDHLPILIGGSGPRKTLRTTALRADAWNTSGWVEEVREKVGHLERHCADVGRDPADIERTISFPVVIRDTVAGAETAFAELLRHNGSENAGNLPNLLGPPERIAEQLAPYLPMRFATIIVRLPAPYDRETIDRIGEVGAAIDQLATPVLDA